MQKIYFIVLLCYSFCSYGAGCFDKSVWKNCSLQGDVKVCSAPVTGSEILAYRGETEINASMQNLVSVFYNTQKYKKWQVDLKNIEVVQNIVPLGEKPCLVERVEHSFGKKPWYASWAFWLPDSSFVYKATYQMAPGGEQFGLYLDNLKSADIPERKGYQRGEVRSCYLLNSTDDPKKTHLSVELWVQLNLNVPNSRVNANLSKWPTQLISGLRKYLDKNNMSKMNSNGKKFVAQCLASNVSQ